MNFRLPVLVAASRVWTAAIAAAGEPANPHVPLQKTIGRPMAQGPVPSLGVINAQGADLAEGKLTLSGVSGNIIVFADRPVRATGHETKELFISRWGWRGQSPMRQQCIAEKLNPCGRATSKPATSQARSSQSPLA